MTGYTRPPRGLTPRFLVSRYRLTDVEAAIERYMEAGLEVPEIWVEEQQDLRKYLEDIPYQHYAQRPNVKLIGHATYDNLEYPIRGTRVAVTEAAWRKLEERAARGEIRITNFEGLPAAKNGSSEKNI